MQKLNQIKDDVESNNDSILHLRQVTNLLQNEIEVKNKEIESVQSKLDDSERRNMVLEIKLKDKEREVDRNVVLMQKELKEQSETIRTLVQSFNNKNADSSSSVNDDDIYHTLCDKKEQMMGDCVGSEYIKIDSKDVMNDNIGFNNCAKKQLDTNSLNSNIVSENDSYDSENASYKKDMDKMPLSIYKPSLLAVEGRQSQNHSNTTNVHNNDAEMGSDESVESDEKYLDIEQRQLRLRKELKDIYKKIKSVLPPKERNRRSSRVTFDDGIRPGFEAKDNDNENKGLETERILREESRPWRKTVSGSDSRSKSTAAELGLMLAGIAE
jgi:hypothetical protein